MHHSVNLYTAYPVVVSLSYLFSIMVGQYHDYTTPTLPSKSFEIHHSSITVTLDAVLTLTES
jgi:hypothetical protein